MKDMSDQEFRQLKQIAELKASNAELVEALQSMVEGLSLELDQTDQDTGQTYLERIKAILAKVKP